MKRNYNVVGSTSADNEKRNHSSSQPVLSDVDGEITIAENKINVQKIFKKSLETVQNVNNSYTVPVPNVVNKQVQDAINDSPIVSTRFQSRIPIEGSNATTLALMRPMRPASALPPVNLAKSVYNLPPPEKKKVQAPTVMKRCMFWPECKNPSCLYIHPSTECKMFPNCSYGQQCIYIHPLCKFGVNCSNNACQFMHHMPSDTSDRSSRTCKYYPNCTKPDCIFLHVDKPAKPCHFGTSCRNRECKFSHEDTEQDASLRKREAESLSHVSERKFAAHDAAVSHLPVSIVTSNKSADLTDVNGEDYHYDVKSEDYLPI